MTFRLIESRYAGDKWELVFTPTIPQAFCTRLIMEFPEQPLLEDPAWEIEVVPLKPAVTSQEPPS